MTELKSRRGVEGDRAGLLYLKKADRIGRVGSGLMWCVTLAFVVVFLRVAQLEMAPGARLTAQRDHRISKRPERARRGDLLDRRGRLIAGAMLGRRVFVDPVRFEKPYNASVVALARAMNIDADEVGTRVLSRIASNERRRRNGRQLIRYVSIGRVLDEAHIASVRHLDMAGVHLERRAVRVQPSGVETASLIGVVGADDIGLTGVEGAFDERLRSRDGELAYLRDARGRSLWIETGAHERSKAGEDVRLSVDLVVQQIALEELEQGVAEADAAGGRLVAIDPLTGEILAMVDIESDLELPVFKAPYDERERYRTLAPNPVTPGSEAPMRNRCVEDAYEPGSTFKPFMWSSVTELGLASADEMFDTEGGVWRTPYRRVVSDVLHRDEQTWMDVLVNSSNIGMAKGCARMTPSQMQRAVRRFGFGSRTRAGLPGESLGLVTPASRWSVYTQTSVAFGYEIAVTTVQMVRAFSAFARDGELAGTLAPIRITAPERDDTAQGLVLRVLPVWTAILTREAMRRVAANVDRRLLRNGVISEPPLYEMFGKSGTAKIARPDGKGYFENQYVSSFIAGAPIERPRIVVLVVMDDPGPDRVRSRRHYGSSVAGPVVRRFIERTLRYMGAAPSAGVDDNREVAGARGDQNSALPGVRG